MKNFSRLFRIMLRHWVYMVVGLIFMFGYAALSGVTITMVIPLFDYIFKPHDTPALYHNLSQLWDALVQTIGMLKEQIGNLFSFARSADFKPISEQLKQIMAHTEPLFLLYVICGTVIIITLVKNLFFYLNKIMFANLRGKTIMSIRNAMFEKYLKQSLAFFNANKVGDSIVRMVSDVDIVNDMMLFPLFNVVRDVVLLSVYIIIALSINAQLFLYSLLILPIFSLLLSLLGKKVKKYSKRIQSKFSDMFSDIEEVLNNMRIVKAFSREERELDRFKDINLKYFRFWRKSVIYAGINIPLSELTGTLIGVVIIILGGSLILSPGSNLQLGSFSAFLLAVFSMQHPIKELTQAYANIKKAQVSLERIFHVLSQRSEIVNSPNAMPKKTFDRSIELKNVWFSYDGAADVLKDISLEIRKGEKVALVGSSGSGKTTLVNLLPRMYDITRGEILIDGINIKDIDLKDLRMLFGTVTQDSILFSDTVGNNIRYGSLQEISDAQLREAARISYADEYIEKLPKKYDEMLYQKGANLSGGQKQRLCIARAVVSNPPILIFDEATSALDTESEQKVQQAIDQATQNRTVVVIAHRLSTVLAADKIVVLDQGRIVGMGKHPELLKTCPRYQKLYRLQFSDYQEA
ncbi:MAG: ABC transporter ATP-binding protein/permease [candidate division KSB1 bacterium]|nr:ABC transporter ATP-binding protein/permease [candidate division KSB1 bacterium]MDZ7335481.1 ABC transporter ATP-binding protein/permease [candidate division KSB1 bacterium]MDZ7357644.1 ABC transporter ATP-binding protein/permease [candidate division KSB1 bacterium]MDZ7399212.1 ABC transporter ATP-binding protein/permease [candidate division KSB1 bacterium]